MYKLTTLSNKLRIITSEMPHTRSVTIAIYAAVGSRHEPDDIAGMSHFIEHMLFKGTERRPTTRDISEAIEGVGGVMNAATDKELTVYWCKVASPHFAVALDVLSDILLHSILDGAEIEKERQVIIEELNNILDTPGDLVNVLIDELLWPGHPLGRDVGGTRESVSGITRDQMLAYLAQQYCPARVVVSVAGNVSHEQVVDAVQARLGSWEPVAAPPVEPAVDNQQEPRLRVWSKRTEQAHLCLGVPALSYSDPRRFVQNLMNVVVGEGMSSRLFLEIREKRGLAYDVHSYITQYTDAGAAVIYAGLDPTKTETSISALLEQMRLLREQPVPESEMRKAKELTKGHLLLRMEDTRGVATWFGVQELLLGQILTVDDVVNLIEDVQAEQIQELACQLFQDSKLSLAIIGPFKAERRFRRLLQIGG